MNNQRLISDASDMSDSSAPSAWGRPLCLCLGAFLCGGLVCGGAVYALLAPRVPAAEAAAMGTWDYNGFHTGDWAQRGYPLCDGHRSTGTDPPNNQWQAPIDIGTPELARPTQDVIAFSVVDGGCPNADMEYNDHTEEVYFGEHCQNLRATWKGRTYTMVQFHFHMESENMVSGGHYDGELHMVHQDEGGAVLVVGLFMQLSSGSPPANDFLRKIFRHGFDNRVWDNMSPNINPYEGLIEEGSKFWNFLGSFTTPPCTPNVEWVLYREPIATARESLSQLKSFLRKATQADSYGHDFRPVQPLNGRTIFVGTSGHVRAIAGPPAAGGGSEHH